MKAVIKPKRIYNKRARFNYQLEDAIEAGIVLTGSEVKAFKHGGVNLSNAYVKFLNGEPCLVGANFMLENTNDNDPTRSRKLLMHKNQITSTISQLKARRLTFVPVSMYNKGRLIKISVALGKPKKKYDKRASIKEKDR